MTPETASPEDVLKLWFDLPNKNAEDDNRVREKLRPHYERAVTGDYDHWEETPEGRLALIILFDQVPRHLFRNQPKQYATDKEAVELAEPFVEDEFPQSFDSPEIFYAAMPYLHAEDPEKQRAVNPIIHDCAEEIDELSFMGDVADNYLDIIETFERFPHRNEILGRESSPAEEKWLEQN